MVRPRLLIMVVLVCVLTTLLSQLGMLHSDFLGLSVPLAATRHLSGVPSDAASRCFGAWQARALGEGATSIVAVNANRTTSLRGVLPSWLAVRGVSEVVLVEWGSPAEGSVLSSRSAEVLGLRAALADPRVRLVRAPRETEWNLARAYNLAVQMSRGETILKAGADTRTLRLSLSLSLTLPAPLARSRRWTPTHGSRPSSSSGSLWARASSCAAAVTARPTRTVAT